MEEAINLNLSKQVRKYQKKYERISNLEALFGKNIYRLYYDLETGKQITPTRKTPAFKMDVHIEDRLKNDIESVLNNYEYQVIDYNKNSAKKIDSNQPIKLTKVLAKYDTNLLKKYTNFLDSMTKNIADSNQKYYAVISRHSHDITNMGGFKFETCENLESETDIKQTWIRDDDSGSEGNGASAGEMIRGNHLVFYMIREGDWNIQDPISRFASGIYCENIGPYYGEFSSAFKNFVIQWLYNFEVTHKDTKLLPKDTYWAQPEDKLIDDFFDVLYHRNFINKMNSAEFVRELINRKKYDLVVKFFERKKGTEIYGHMMKEFVYTIVNDVSPGIVKTFPHNLSSIILTYVRDTLQKKLDSTSKNLIGVEKIIKNLPTRLDLYIQSLGLKTTQTILKDTYEFRSLFLTLRHDDFLPDYEPFIILYRTIDTKLPDTLKNTLLKLEKYYNNWDGVKAYQQQALEYLSQKELNEEVMKVKKMMGYTR